MRGIPFYGGLLTAVAVEELNKRKAKLSKVGTGAPDVSNYVRVIFFVLLQTTVFVWTFVVVAVTVLVQYHGARFYDRHRPYDVVEQASYAIASRSVWTVMLSWIVVCHFTSGYGTYAAAASYRCLVWFSWVTTADDGWQGQCIVNGTTGVCRKRASENRRPGVVVNLQTVRAARRPNETLELLRERREYVRPTTTVHRHSSLFGYRSDREVVQQSDLRVHGQIIVFGVPRQYAGTDGRRIRR